MAGTEYYLYRVKFIKPAQLSLLLPSLSPSQVFLEAINEKPEMMLSSGSEWHLGNVDFFDQLTGSFAIGRTTKTTLEKFDKESGNFIDQLDDSSPYTTVVFDCRIGLLGIAKKSKLAPDAETVALFEKSETVIHTGSEVKVNFIPDPQGFIQKLRAAYAIKSFKATFTGPNPVDADELFQKPLSVYAQQIGAQTGSLEVKGEALNEEVAESIAKSTAATANTASARIIPAEGKKVVPIRMKGDAVSVVVSLDASYRDVLARIQDEYSRVRG
ncbi:hypothetical protein [Vibrio splendidus]|uniref:hypothetical protein n=1 Tax=Vibrio splendidus TaxID=29497 RepID=UPI001E4D1A1D|nr:hypothetical protein [Vibrio splendidus]MCC4863339.1 hypothetical protein [Vibrio splendidus]